MWTLVEYVVFNSSKHLASSLFKYKQTFDKTPGPAVAKPMEMRCWVGWKSKENKVLYLPVGLKFTLF